MLFITTTGGIACSTTMTDGFAAGSGPDAEPEPIDADAAKPAPPCRDERFGLDADADADVVSGRPVASATNVAEE